MSVRPLVLLVSELYPPAVGGTPVLFENVYSRVAGADVIVLTSGAGDRVQDAREGAVRVVRRPDANRHWGILQPSGLRWHVSRAREIARLTAGRSAVVHCGRALPEGVAALIARTAFGAPPFVCWTHGEEITYARRSRELRLLLRRVYRGAAGVIANSRNTRRLLEAEGVPAERIRVVYPGVDAGRFTRRAGADLLRRRFAPNGESVLLSVGRLQRRKGHDVVIQALGEMRSGTERLRYVIVGDGDERQRLERLVDVYKLIDRVTFAGEVSDADLPAFYAAADMFVHPNRDDAGDIEGFGIVFLEAAAAGLPTIGGNSGGVPEAIEDGVTGFLVDGNNPDELAQCIRLLARSAALRRQMGDAGRARVVRDFTWERAAAHVLTAHEGLELVA